jgi:DNA-binding transcriptional ArsR family regulator
MLNDTHEIVKPWLVYGYRSVNVPKARSAKRPVHTLVQTLGRNAARVWCALLGLRDPDTGLAHPSIAGVARRLGLARRTVDRALRRLGQLGLVYSHGKKFVERAGRRVWTRFVWGALVDGFAWVPRWTAKHLGVGAVARDLGENAQRVREFIRAECPAKICDIVSGTGMSRSSVNRALRQLRDDNVVVGLAVVDDTTHPSGTPWHKSGAPIQIGIDRKPSYIPTGYTQSSRAPAREDSEKNPVANHNQGYYTENGWQGGYKPFGTHRCRRDWWNRLLADGILPRLRYGKRREIPWVSVPLPEKLDPSRSPEDNAWILAVAYRDFARRKSGKRSHIFARGKFENSKHFKTLVEWARIMTQDVSRESQIPPVVWIAFRDRVWGKDSIPPVGYVFGSQFVAKPSNRGWCRQEAVDVLRVQPGLQRWSPEAAELRERYWTLKNACLTAPEWYPDEIVRRLFDRLFPDGVFGELVQAARIGQRRYQDRLNKRVASGDLSVYTEAVKS